MCDINENKSVDDEGSNCEKTELSAVQRQRIERNRQKALLLRKARIANASKVESTISQKEVSTTSRPRDTGSGFFVEDDDDDDFCSNDRPLVNPPAPLFAEDRPKCEECGNEFSDSYLQVHFDYPVCDSCRDNDDAHCLISKTDAKKEYLLKDCDFDKREPPLRYILKKNPHNKHGNMKLYLRLQVEKRALEIYGSENELEEVKEQRAEAQEKRKQKAFDRKVKSLRMTVRSSLYRKKDTGHDHVYGPESYDEDEDMYEKVCTSCGHTLRYEKM